ncbi:hypothetical protein ACFL1G_10250 [Planctomycetota bacterium]
MDEESRTEGISNIEQGMLNYEGLRLLRCVRNDRGNIEYPTRNVE